MLAPVAEPCILFPEDPPTGQESSKNSDDSRTTNKQPETEIEKPPAVPPKSPRMMGRSPSVSQRGMASKYTSPARRAPLSIDKNSTVRNASIDTESPSATHVATQLRNPLTRPRAATATDFRPSEGPSSRVHQRSESASAATGSASETSERFPARSTHKTELPETSIMDRGRPTKRRSHSKDRTIKELPSAEYVASKPLPSGVIPSEAASHFSIADLEKLQDQARGQAQKFEVLKYRDVKALSQVRFSPLSYSFACRCHVGDLLIPDLAPRSSGSLTNVANISVIRTGLSGPGDRLCTNG